MKNATHLSSKDETRNKLSEITNKQKSTRAISTSVCCMHKIYLMKYLSILVIIHISWKVFAKPTLGMEDKVSLKSMRFCKASKKYVKHPTIGFKFTCRRKSDTTQLSSILSKHKMRRCIIQIGINIQYKQNCATNQGKETAFFNFLVIEVTN